MESDKWEYFNSRDYYQTATGEALPILLYTFIQDSLRRVCLDCVKCIREAIFLFQESNIPAMQVMLLLNVHAVVKVTGHSVDVSAN